MNGSLKPRLKIFATRLITSNLHRLFAVTRGMTLGVRAACFDEEGRIFLVRHTYVPGWHMPGGGVEHYESAGDALVKELREEGNLEIIGSPRLFHIYFNRSASKRDHVLFYRVDVRQTAPRPPDREIRDCGFFPLHALPEGVTQATLRRLAELHSDLPVTAIW